MSRFEALKRATIGGKRMGKTEAMRKELAAYLQRNPNAVVCYVGASGTRVEKPIEGEVVGLDRLPSPK